MHQWAPRTVSLIGFIRQNYARDQKPNGGIMHGAVPNVRERRDRRGFNAIGHRESALE